MFGEQYSKQRGEQPLRAGDTNAGTALIPGGAKQSPDGLLLLD